MTTNAIRLWMHRAKVPAGLEGKRVSPHVSHASAATDFAASGVSAFGVQRFLRHRTPTMSQRYVDLGSIDSRNSTRARRHSSSCRAGSRDCSGGGNWCVDDELAPDAYRSSNCHCEKQSSGRGQCTV
jgi:hypothetical protein